MKQFVLGILRKLVGRRYWVLKNNYRLNQIKKKVLAYYASVPAEQLTDEKKKVVHFLKKNPVSVFPYPFSQQYDQNDIEVFLDEKLGLRYVLPDNKRLYFKRSFSDSDIQWAYNMLKMEQDVASPHRYLTADFQVDNGDVVVDAGAADGNFSLSVVEKAGAIYIFETESEWIEALEATFAPWKEKVHIVNKFISNVNDARNATLDDFFADKGKVDFLKIDVDGGERPLLKGVEQIMSSKKPLKVALCSYHQQNDEQEFTDLLQHKGFQVTPSDGYMLFIYDEALQAPYFRRGLLRATRH